GLLAIGDAILQRLGLLQEVGTLGGDLADGVFLGLTAFLAGGLGTRLGALGIVQLLFHLGDGDARLALGLAHGGIGFGDLLDDGFKRGLEFILRAVGIQLQSVGGRSHQYLLADR